MSNDAVNASLMLDDEITQRILRTVLNNINPNYPIHSSVKVVEGDLIAALLTSHRFAHEVRGMILRMLENERKYNSPLSNPLLDRMKYSL